MDPARGAGADAEVEAARQRARESRPRAMTRPDPVELPPLREPTLETLEADIALGDFIPDGFLYEPSESLAAWADIWHRDLRFRLSSHRGGLVGRFIVWSKRLLSRVVRAPLSAELQRERIFAIVMLRRQQRMLAELRRYLLEVRDPYSFLRDKAVPQLVARADALFSILDQRSEELEAELRRLREEQSFRARVGASPATAASSPAAGPPEVVAAPRRVADDDPAYYAFEALHRGTEAEIRERQSIYLEVFRGRDGVVDLGSGRGEMLDLLRDAGIRAYGVDLNTSMMAQCGARGLQVVQADAIAHLRSLQDESLGGVFSAQTFEHWEREPIVEAVRLIYRKLADGAPFVMETQNPTSLTVGASSFWRDLTHVRPIHPDAFEFLVRAVGFRAVEVRPLAPFPEAERLPRVHAPAGLDAAARAVVDDVNRVVDALDRRLHGHRDYAVIAHK